MSALELPSRAHIVNREKDVKAVVDFVGYGPAETVSRSRKYLREDPESIEDDKSVALEGI